MFADKTTSHHVGKWIETAIDVDPRHFFRNRGLTIMKIKCHSIKTIRSAYNAALSDSDFNPLIQSEWLNAYQILTRYVIGYLRQTLLVIIWFVV